MSFHFASSEYAGCFQGVPVPNVPKIRQSAVDYMDSKPMTTAQAPQEWYDDPIATLFMGTKLHGDVVVDTVNALGEVNGRQKYTNDEDIQRIKEHLKTYVAPQTDYRVPIRRVEQVLLNEYAGFLIGNQCWDFAKQDGITEIEEAVMANHVERKLNDLVLRDEVAGKIAVQRKPIYVSCVSNFTNFLDLFRKTIRSLEVGIPCVILGRSNTSQHCYRWAKLLMDLCVAEGIDPGMITFLSCPLEQIKDITQGLQAYTGNLYATCSRDLAANIKSGYPNTVASTGGPNTLIAMDWTQPIQDAIRMSATIESSGQCTALRHVVVPPSVQAQDIEQMLGSTKAITSPADAMKSGGFDGVFANHTGSPPGPTDKDGYQRHGSVDASYRITKGVLAPNHIHEHWRKVVVDVSQIDTPGHLDEISDWLNINQPISMAVTGRTKEESMDIGLALWSKTGLVVNTIGSPESPALTCQARPQEAEVFGEFPPRRDLEMYTKYPVVVPSSTPSYDAVYTASFLAEQADHTTIPMPSRLSDYLADIQNPSIKGYSVTLLEYLMDATQENPKRGFGTSRTAMWGLQRPPLQTKTYLCCNTNWDDLAPSLLVFFATNAKDQVVVVTENATIQDLCQKHGVAILAASSKDVVLKPGDNIKTMDAPMEAFPMVGQFLTTLLPVGHIKSTTPNDEEFVSRVKTLDKWLQMA